MISPKTISEAKESFSLYDSKFFSIFHVKVIVFAGMGLFTDAYALFSISLMVERIF
jgi:hypothetical protein